MAQGIGALEAQPKELQTQLSAMQPTAELERKMQEDNEVLRKAVKVLNADLAKERAKNVPLVDADGFTRVAPSAENPSVPTENRFQRLQTDPAATTQQKAEPRCSPIYVKASGVRKAVDLLQEIGVGKGDCLVAQCGKDKVRLAPRSSKTKIHLALVEKEVGHQVFKKKSERPLKAVLTGLGDFSEEEVMKELAHCEQLVKKPEAVVRMKRFDLHTSQKVGTDLFTVTFPAGTKLADLQHIKR